MRQETMKRILFTAICLIMLPLVNSNCQDSNILDQFQALDMKTITQIIDEDITVKEIENEEMGLMPEDSLNYKYIDKIYKKRLVRLDVSAIEKAFPEVVTITTDGDFMLDYISMIPLMMEAIHEQQKLIVELESRLYEIEQATKN